MSKRKGVGVCCPRHANPELYDVIYPVVLGAIRGWKNDHPEVMGPDGIVAGMMVASLLKRLCSQLTAPDVEARLRTALTGIST
jgi:hypothetical protein